ncbi:15765_t:CDS:1, partial [Racocetra persica]
YTNQDKVSSGSENKDIELSNSVGLSSKTSHKKHTSKQAQKTKST